MPTCYTTKEEKAKEKNRAAFNYLDARNDASARESTSLNPTRKSRQDYKIFTGFTRGILLIMNNLVNPV